MTARCESDRRFRFFFFFCELLCSRRIYGSADLCFCRCLTIFILFFGTAWKHWPCVEVFFFVFSDVTTLCLRFYANREGIPNEKEFCKIFYFYTVTCCYLDLFREVSRLFFKIAVVNFLLYIAFLMCVFLLFRLQSTNMCLLILWLVLVYFLLFLRSEPIMCYKVIQEGKKEGKKKIPRNEWIFRGRQKISVVRAI